MKYSGKKSLVFLFGSVILVLFLFYFVSNVNIEGMTLLQQDLQNVQMNLNKTKNSGNPHDNWNIIKNDVNILSNDLNTAYNSQTDNGSSAFNITLRQTPQGSGYDYGPGTRYDYERGFNKPSPTPISTTSSLTQTSVPVNTTTPTITTAALTTPTITTAELTKTP